VKNNGNLLYVTTGKRTAIKYIEELILKHQDSILKKINSLRNKTSYKKQMHYFGKEFSIVCAQQKDEIKIDILNKICYINFSTELNEIEFIKKFSTFYKKEAEKLFIVLLDYWSDKMKLKFSSMRIGNAKTLWGSCNTINKIFLNYNLIQYKKSHIEYIVVHELAHIKHKNHSAKFWNLVENFLPNYKETKKEMRAMKTLHY
jgi:predicted metal-dependent hydrolase